MTNVGYVACHSQGVCLLLLRYLCGVSAIAKQGVTPLMINMRGLRRERDVRCGMEERNILPSGATFDFAFVTHPNKNGWELRTKEKILSSQ